MSRRAQILFILSFLTIIFFVPVSQACIEMYRGQRPRFLDLFTRAPTRPNLRDFERQLEDSSVYARAVRPWIQYLWFALLRYPGEKALVGRDSWLFYKPDVRYLVEPNRFDDPVRAIVNFRDQLARRRIRLMVLPMPGKPSVYSDKLTSRAADFHSPTQELIPMLRKAGVETLDLFTGLPRDSSGAPVFLARDTHWSCTAAWSVAETVARRLRELGWVKDASAEYQLRSVRVRRRGDIVRMMDIPSLELRFPAEEMSCDQVIRDGRPYKDDPRSPVLVLGDSFLRIYQTDEPGSAGFIAGLARELKQPLISIVNDGGASTLVRQELSRRPDLFKQTELVIWEFAERDLRFGTEGWKLVPLPSDAIGLSR